MKTLSEKIVVMQGAERGAKIRITSYKTRMYTDQYASQFLWNWEGFDYDIITPEPTRKLVPFTLEEWQARRGIPVRLKDHPKEWETVLGGGISDVRLSDGDFYSPCALLDCFEFLDGSPCGKWVNS